MSRFLVPAKVDIKPLSVNNAWKGKRYKTPRYKRYERDLLLLLPKDIEIPKGELAITINFGMSYSGADIDNPIKPFLDILQKKYGFNDNRIVSMNVRKTKTKRGEEYIHFRIKGAI